MERQLNARRFAASVCERYESFRRFGPHFPRDRRACVAQPAGFPKDYERLVSSSGRRSILVVTNPGDCGLGMPFAIGVGSVGWRIPARNEGQQPPWSIRIEQYAGARLIGCHGPDISSRDLVKVPSQAAACVIL